MHGQGLLYLPRILCVDDDPCIATAIELRLRSYEVEVHSASNWLDGEWMAMEELPDVIITDMRMPHGGGDTLVECLKGRVATAEIPIIALTGRPNHAAKRWMQILGVRHYLRKPCEIAALMAALEDYIELQPACGVSNHLA
ncbi:MAG: response regulator [Planctomycetota bacterium]|nr:response regulator [Planctomycetota bacterium]